MSVEGVLTSVEEKIDRLRDHIDERTDKLTQTVNDLAVKVGELSVKLDNIHSHYATKDDLGSVRSDLKWIKWLIGAAVVALLGAVARAWIQGGPVLGG